MPIREPFSLDDLRLYLSIRLAVAPRYWFRDLWAPKNREKDRARDTLVEHLVEGLGNVEMTRERRVDRPGGPFALVGIAPPPEDCAPEE